MVAQHTVKAFDDDITRMHGMIAEMGGLAELSVQEAMEALVSGNLELASRVIERDKRIDAIEAEVDKFAITVLALRAPVADDLRDVIGTLKIAGIIERIGDYAKNIAKRVGQIDGRHKFEPLTLLPAMNDLAGEMVHDVLTAYAARDAEAAAEILQRDSRVDAFYDSIFRNLVSYMVENPATISTAAQLLFVARNIERIGDHATNIAEVVYYSVTGKTLPEREKGGAGA